MARNVFRASSYGLAILAVFLPLAVAWNQVQDSTPSEWNGSSAGASTFEPNRGQFGPKVTYVLRTGGGRVVFDGAEVAFLPSGPRRDPAAQASRTAGRVHDDRLAFAFDGAEVDGRLEPTEPLPGIVHYFSGSDPEGWVTDVPTFSGLIRRQVYPGIDVTYRGNGRGLDLEFRLAAGADPESVVLDFGPSGRFSLDALGDALLATTSGTLRIVRPAVETAEPDSGSGTVVGSLSAAGGTLGMRLEGHDPSRPLKIRLAMILVSGDADSPSAGAGELPRLTMDPSGSLYIAGTVATETATPSRRGPENASPRAGRAERATPVPRETNGPTLADRTEMFVSRLDPSGSEVLETAYLGGEGQDVPLSLSTATDGTIVLAGSFETGGGNRDAFVTRLSPTGMRPLQNVRIGGSGEERAHVARTDAQGNTWIAGFTDSADLPVTADSIQPAAGGGGDAFVARLDAAGNLTFLTYLGGSGRDAGTDLALDADGKVHLTGVTASTDLPLVEPLQPSLGGGSDVFLATVEPVGGSLVFSTFLGGTGDESGPVLGIDRSGEILLAGSTTSTDFPVMRGEQPVHGGPGSADAFLVRVARDGSGILYATYLGGMGSDAARAVALDGRGEVWIAGTAGPGSFDGADIDRRGSGGRQDAFLTRLRTDDSRPAETHVLAGNRDDEAAGLALDPNGGAIVAGRTRSDELPGSSRPQATSTGDVFVARIQSDEPAPRGVCPGTKQWVGGPAGTWQTAANWSGGTLPTSSDDVCIENAAVTVSSGSQNAGTLRVQGAGASLTLSTGTLTIAGASEINAPFTQTGGTLTGTGNVTVTGLLTWSGGTMSGSGSTTAQGGIVLDTSSRTLTRTLNNSNNGTATHSGNGSLTINSPGVFNNTAGATYEHQSDATINGSGTFNNAGTFLRTTSSGTFVSSVDFHNTGNVDVQTGKMNLNTSGTHTGDFVSTSPGILEFGFGTHTFSATSDISGSRVEWTGPTATLSGTYVVTDTLISGGTITMNIPAAMTTLEFTGGTLTGTGTLTVSGLFTWSGGTMAGTGVTNAQGGIAFNTAFGKVLTRTLNNTNNGTATYTGTGAFTINTPGVFNNTVGATFEHQTDANFNGTGTFNNAGTFLRTTSSGTVSINVVFHNTGNVDVQTGRLDLSDNGTHTGDFVSTSPGILEFGFGTHTFSATSDISGSRVEWTGATATLSGTYTVTDTLISSGTITMNIPAAMTTLELTGGTLTGTGAVTVSGLFTWSGGTMSGTGVTNAQGGIAFTTAFGKTLTRTLNNANNGTATYTGTGAFTINTPGVFNNTAGATFEHQTNANFNGSGTFNNAGTFLRTTSTGTLTCSAIFNNTGNVDVQTGRMTLNDNGTHTGDFVSTSPGILEFGFGTHTFSATSDISGSRIEWTGATATLSGTYVVTDTLIGGGTTTINIPASMTTLELTGGTLTGTGTLTVSGLFTWSGGTMAGTGVTNAQGGIAFTTAFSKTLTRTLNNTNNGTATYTGTGAFTINTPGVFNNTTGATFEHQTDANFNGTGTFNNPGTFLRTTSTGTVTCSVVFHNTGNVDVQTGRMNFNANGNHTGDFVSTSPGILEFGFGTQTFSATSDISGSRVEWTGPTATLSGTYTVTDTLISSGTITMNIPAAMTTLELTGGTLTGTGDITITGLFTWSSGTMSGTGVTNAQGGIAFTTAFGKTLTRTLNNANNGTATYTGTGAFTINTPGIFNNTTGATFEHQTDANFNGTGTFSNAGTFLRTTASGTVTSSVIFNNSGTVDVQTGRFDLSDNGTHTGDFVSTSPGILEFGFGTHTFSATSDISGSRVEWTGATATLSGTYAVTDTLISSGTVNFNIPATMTTLELTGGTLSGSATVTVSGLFTWSGGTMSGTGVTNAQGGIAFTTVFGKVLTRTLNNTNTGTATYTGTGALTINTPGVFHNTAGATFEHQTDANFNGTGTFDNSGTFLRTTSSGTVSSSVVFNNNGNVDVQTGRMDLNDNGTHTGDFVSTSPGIMRFGFGTHTFSATSDISGSRMEWTGATATLSGTYAVTSTLISGGTVNFNIPAAMTTLELTGGALDGTGNATVSGLLTWSGGNMQGSGITGAQGGIDFSGVFGKTLSRTLNHGNNQIATYTGSGSWTINSPGVFNNLSGSTFDHRTDAGVFGTGTFANAGTFQRTMSSGTLSFFDPFVNTGTVEIVTGTLNFGNAFTQTAGATILNGGALNSSINLVFQGGSLEGNGTVTGPLVNNTGGSLAPGFSAGTLTLVGDYTQGAGGAFDVELGGLTAGTQYDQAVITNPGFGTGDATLSGALNVSLIDAFDPSIGDSFTIMTFDTRAGQFSTTNLPAFGCGRTWDIVYSATDVVLQVVAEAGTADLTVTNVDSPDPVAVGDPVTYTVTVANGGPDSATGVVLTDDLGGATFVSATPDQGSCSESGGTVTCNLGTIASGADAVVTVVATPTGPGTLTNTASANSNECDPSLGDETDIAASTTVLPACPDADNDGYALCDVSCLPAGGDLCGDCDDTRADVFPGATELCDGLDNDCDGTVPANEADADGDGFRVCQNDCDDTDATVNPGVIEDDPFCADGIDNDCDGAIDLDDPSCLGICPDTDNDGYAVCDAGCTPDAGDQCGDCNDTNAAVNPGATESCNGVDDNCDGTVPANEADADGDGFRICQNDCNDTDPAINPGAAEACNGVDDNCDGTVPANEADADGDGFRLCQNDCNDTDPAINPGAAEACNGVDDNCDGTVPANEADGDGDGVRVCQNDCDDGDASRFPGAAEACDGVDNNCDDVVPTNEADVDGDGYRICQNDCNDVDPNVNPGVVETGTVLCADDIDNDCDGLVDVQDVQGCALTVTTCSTLGDQPSNQVIDEDVWTLTGTQGESVTIDLDPAGSGAGRADLILIDDMGDAVDFFRIDRTALSNQITATLPATGAYRLAVKEQPASLLLPGRPFRGDYCLSIDADQGAAQTLAPTSSVEGVPSNR